MAKQKKPRESPSETMTTRNEFLSPHTTHTRAESLNITQPEEGSRIVELSFSSETPVRMWGFDEILIHTKESVDLTRITEVGALLYNHNPWDVRNVVGRVLEASVDEKERKCRARVEFDADESAELVFQKVQGGSIRGVSVGYRVNRWEQVDEDTTTTDGIEGPALVAREWEPYEISFTPIPADPTVGPGRSLYQIGGDNMRKLFGRSEDEDPKKKEDLEEDEEEREEDEDAKKNDKEEDEEEREEDDEKKDDERGVKAERRRVAEIVDVCAAFGVDPSSYIRRGSSVAAVNAAILKRQREDMLPMQTSRSTSATCINRDERDKFRSAVVDGLALRVGTKIEKAAPGAHEFRGVSLFDLARIVLERNGERFGWNDHKMDIAARAFSTSDFPFILSNLARKVLQAGYDEAPSTWRAWCATGSLPDFKENYKLRMSEAPNLELVGESGEYKTADFTETEDGYRLQTYGKKFALTRQSIINDDLGAFTRIPSLFGVASGRTINTDVYGLLVSNPKMKEDGKTMFHADHGNLGAAAKLSVESLNDARKSMRRQKGIRKDGGNYLNIAPSALIIPPEQETLARQLLFSTADIGQANPAVINPFHGSLDIVVDATLTDTKAWYLVASPGMIDTIEVAFLDGVQNPVIDHKESWDVDGIEYKVRMDYATKAWDYRGIYKNPGA